MAQHDQVIDNASGLAVRTDINAALAALFSSSSGTLEPTVKTAGQFWFDTTSSPGILRVRNAANNAWITVSALSAVDMGTGIRTSPDRWVVNENAALTGRDYLSVADGTGVLTIQDILNMVEVDGSIRGKLQVGIGADAGTIYCVVYDAAGTEVNRWIMNSAGLALKAGSYRFYTTVYRGQMAADLAGATGRLTFETNTNAGVLDSTMVLSASGLALNTVGDFYVSRAGVVRANFGWDSTLGTYIRQRNASGTINAELDLAPAGASLQFGDYRLVTAAGVLRGAMIAERVATTGKVDIESYTSAGVIDGELRVDASGVSLPLVGDYDIERSGVKRTSYGWAAGSGAYIRHRDTGGVINGEFVIGSSGAQLLYNDYNVTRANVSRAQFGFDATLDSLLLRHRDAAGATAGEAHLRDALFSLRIGAAADGVGSFALEDNAGQVRGRLTNNNNTATIRIVNLDAAGTVISQLVAGGANLTYSPPGVAAQNVRTDTNIINQTTGQGETNFPIGTYVLAYSATGSEPNRNVDALVRLPASGTFAYQNGGGGTQLTGTWRSRGTMIVTASPAILMQRVS